MQILRDDTNFNNKMILYYAPDECNSYEEVNSTTSLYLSNENLKIGETYLLKIMNNTNQLAKSNLLYSKKYNFGKNLPNPYILDITQNQTFCIGTMLFYNSNFQISSLVSPWGIGIIGGHHLYNSNGDPIGIILECSAYNLPSTLFGFLIDVGLHNSSGTASTVYKGFLTILPQFTSFINCNIVDFSASTCITDPFYSSYCTYQWDYNDGTPLTTPSISPLSVHSYNSIGNYNPKLIVTYNFVNGIPIIQQIINNITITNLPQPTTNLKIIVNNNDCDLYTTYSIQNPMQCTNYSWQLSQGGYIVSGQGTSTVVVEFDHSNSNCNKAILEVIATDANNVSTISSLDIYPCCYDWTEYQFDNFTTHVPLTLSNCSVRISGDFIMMHDVTFKDVILSVSPNSKIKLEAENVKLNIDNTIVGNNIDCCQDMWDGIYTNKISQDVKILNGSVIRNAQNALNIYWGGSFLVENSTFEDNYKNIYIYHGSPLMQTPYPGVIRNTTFYGNNSLPNHPYQGQSTLTGVEAFRTNNLTIGDPSSASYTNNFENLDCGIKAEQSFINVYNNNFLNINFDTNPLGNTNPMLMFSSTAIFCTNPANETYTWGANIGGTGLMSNNIKNCYNGIYAFGLYLNVDNNTINTERMAVQGRDLYDNSSIKNNTIAGSFSATDHTQIGISIDNIQPRYCRYLINSNNINAIYRGITITDANSDVPNGLYVVVYSNIINLDGLNYQGSQNSAIKIANCYGISVSDNYLSISNYTAAANNLLYGIDIAQTRNASIMNNPYINKYGAGINVFGDCNFTQFNCNTLDNCFYGFLFNHQSTITNQGVLDLTNSDNKWIGNYYDAVLLTYRKLWALPSNLLVPTIRWYVHNNPLPSYQINNTAFPNPTNNSIAEFINNTNAQTSCMYLPTPLVTSINANEREALYGKIVRDSNNYLQLEEQYKVYDKTALYRALQQDSTLLNLSDSCDALYQQYYAAEKVSNIGIVQEIEALIKQGNDSLATLKNATIQDQKMIDEFRKTVNEIYLASFAKANYDLTSEQIAILYPIAVNYTPWEGGDAVYIARLMLNLEDNALNVEYSIGPVNPANSETQTLNVKLYPNPAQNQVRIEFNHAFTGNTVLEIYGFAGNLISSSQLDANAQYVIVSTKLLENGIYFYRIFANDEIVSKDKLVIIK